MSRVTIAIGHSPEGRERSAQASRGRGRAATIDGTRPPGPGALGKCGKAGAGRRAAAGRPGAVTGQGARAPGTRRGRAPATRAVGAHGPSEARSPCAAPAGATEAPGRGSSKAGHALSAIHRAPPVSATDPGAPRRHTRRTGPGSAAPDRPAGAGLATSRRGHTRRRVRSRGRAGGVGLLVGRDRLGRPALALGRDIGQLVVDPIPRVA